jgi:glycosyltransferase involved in cell wall biosynthesis
MKVAIITTDSRDYFKDYETPAPYFGTAPQALLSGMENIRGLEVHVISCLRQPSPSPEKIAKNIWYHGLIVPGKKWHRSLYWKCIRNTRRTLASIRPDIVHGQGTELDCAIDALFSGFPNVVTIHGNMREIARIQKSRIGGYLWTTALLEAYVLRRTQGVLCHSHFTADQVRPLARKIWDVPNALRRQFLTQPKAAAKSTHPILLSIGVVYPVKAQLEILRMGRQLADRGLKFEMRFIGSADEKTPYAAEFLQEIAQAEKNGYASYKPYMDPSSLIKEMDAAHALLHFPLTEPFGLVVAEGLARGLKLFAAATGGIKDIAAGAAGAELFEPGDWASAESAIANWLRAGALATPSNLELMTKRYHPDVIARRHVEIYQEVLKQ